MINWIEVKGLNAKVDATLEFEPDLNIITGANGSGKTTLLKLIWYLISGQIDRALYITFDHVSIGTDQFELSISSYHLQDEFQIEWTFDEKAFSKPNDKTLLDVCPEDTEKEHKEVDKSKTSRDVRFEDAEEDCRSLNTDIAEKMKSSLFFPSFRRIESGFSQQILQDTRSARQTGRTRRRGSSARARIAELSPLQDAMSQTSDEQSVDNHKFVTSFSASDITELLSQKHTEILEKINVIYADISRDLAEKMPSNSTTEAQETDSILEQIREDLTNADSEEQELNNPLRSLNGFINDFFSQGITFTEKLTLGKKSNAISPDKLSYGEQQMLSFLCYNAFSSNTTIFIDEPELSLHVDWQRLLFRTLLKQKAGNQFFITTHSPFIYARYPDKEILLGDDRGGEIYANST